MQLLHYTTEKINEVYCEYVQKDPVGIRTIGVGFNLQKFGAKVEIESVALELTTILYCLNDSQIERLFNKDMDSAVGCASSWVSNWDISSELLFHRHLLGL